MQQTPLLSEEQSRSHALRWQIGLAFFAFIVIGANDGAIGVLIPSISGHYQVDKDFTPDPSTPDQSRSIMAEVYWREQ
jgi:hypothetical protein